MKCLCRISRALLVTCVIAPLALRAATPTLAFSTLRHAYVRGETARVQLRLTDAPAGAVVRFDTGGWLAVETPAQPRVDYAIDTALLRAADYDVHARLLHDGREIGRALFPLSVTPERNPQRYPVYRWHGIPSQDFAWWRTRGFNGFVSPRLYDPTTDREPAIRKMLDESARAGFDVGCYLNPFLSTRADWPADAFVESATPASKRARRPKLYPRAPSVVSHAEALARWWVERFAEYPAWTHALLSTEYQIAQNFSPLARQLAREEAGVNVETLGSLTAPLPEHLPQGGLIDDDNPHYRYLRWWWHQGIGDAHVNQRMSAVLKSRRPDVLTWHDPYRLAAVRDTNRGLDAVSTWTYTHPDTRRMLFTTALQAVARPAHQKVMQTITLFLYGRFAVPLARSTAVLGRDDAGGDPFYTAGPDYVREATWLAFSQRPDLLCYYSHSSQSPHNVTRDPDIISPETYDAIGETVRTLVEPFGPMVLAAQRPAAKVAVLMSAVSEWFGRTPRNVGYPNEQFLPFAALLAMNHAPFEVVLDDDILAGALQRYSTLVLPRPSAMTRKMHAAIVAFAARGGKVIADASLGAPIPGAVLTNYDFSAQTRVDGSALARGRAITAENDRAAQERHAADLEPHLAHVTRPARANSPRVVIHTLEAGAVQLVFLVNADKTRGPRFGQHGLHLEEGVRLATEVRVRIHGKPTLYDVLARKPIAYRAANDEAVFDVELPAARGKLIAVYPEPVAAPQIALAATPRAGELMPVRITMRSASGAPLAVPHPLHIEVVDARGRQNEYTRFAACTNGAYELPFRPALNDAPGEWTVRVLDLVAGKTAEAKFTR